jgi:hypothetical protein
VCMCVCVCVCVCVQQSPEMGLDGRYLGPEDFTIIVR